MGDGLEYGGVGSDRAMDRWLGRFRAGHARGAFVRGIRYYVPHHGVVGRGRRHAVSALIHRIEQLNGGKHSGTDGRVASGLDRTESDSCRPEIGDSNR